MNMTKPLKRTMMIGSALLLLMLLIGILVLLIPQNGRIRVDTDGLLRLDRAANGLYTVWETDAGRIEPLVDPGVCEQPEGGFFCYTQGDSPVRWSNTETDGRTFEAATVRVHVFQTDSIQMDGQEPLNLWSPKELYSTTATLYRREGMVEIGQTRVFGNPVLAGDNSDWSEILPVYHMPGFDVTAYRFRTGRTMNRNDRVYWKADFLEQGPSRLCRVLSQPKRRLYPVLSPGASNDTVLESETVCYDMAENRENRPVRLRAYVYRTGESTVQNEDTYQAVLIIHDPLPAP